MILAFAQYFWPITLYRNRERSWENVFYCRIYFAQRNHFYRYIYLVWYEVIITKTGRKRAIVLSGIISFWFYRFLDIFHWYYMFHYEEKIYTLNCLSHSVLTYYMYQHNYLNAIRSHHVVAFNHISPPHPIPTHTHAPPVPLINFFKCWFTFVFKYLRGKQIDSLMSRSG